MTPLQRLAGIFILIVFIALTLPTAAACQAGLQGSAVTSTSEPPAETSSEKPTPAPTTQLPTPEPTPTLTETPTKAPDPSPSPTPSSTPSPSPAPPAGADDAFDGICQAMADFLADPANGQSAGERALALHGGDWHNACVITASEVLRRVGCDIPTRTDYTLELIDELESRGFKRSYDLSGLQPGAVCFTTDSSGSFSGAPTHTFIFLGWSGDGLMNIYDNQLPDYGSQYHTRQISAHLLNDDPDLAKDATAFYLYR